MKLTLLILSLFIVTGSFPGAGAVWAVEDSQTDFCTIRYDGCFSQCAQHNVVIFGVDVPTPRSIACGVECTVAYAGCMMMRFREGV